MLPVSRPAGVSCKMSERSRGLSVSLMSNTALCNDRFISTRLPWICAPAPLRLACRYLTCYGALAFQLLHQLHGFGRTHVLFEVARLEILREHILGGRDRFQTEALRGTVKDWSFGAG